MLLYFYIIILIIIIIIFCKNRYLPSRLLLIILHKLWSIQILEAFFVLTITSGLFSLRLKIILIILLLLTGYSLSFGRINNPWRRTNHNIITLLIIVNLLFKLIFLLLIFFQILFELNFILRLLIRFFIIIILFL